MARDRLVKIVRDRVEQFIAAHCRVEYRPVDKQTLVKGLRRKLVEEAVEYLEDPSLAELADVYEVLRCLAAHDLDVDLTQVIEHARSKREERGGFEEGVGMFITTDNRRSPHG